MKLYAVIKSAIYRCSVLPVLTFKVAANILLYDLLSLILVLRSSFGNFGVGIGGGVMAGGVFRCKSKITLCNMV